MESGRIVITYDEKDEDLLIVTTDDSTEKADLSLLNEFIDNRHDEIESWKFKIFYNGELLTQTYYDKNKALIEHMIGNEKVRQELGLKSYGKITTELTETLFIDPKEYEDTKGKLQNIKRNEDLSKIDQILKQARGTDPTLVLSDKEKKELLKANLQLNSPDKTTLQSNSPDKATDLTLPPLQPIERNILSQSSGSTEKKSAVPNENQTPKNTPTTKNIKNTTDENSIPAQYNLRYIKTYSLPQLYDFFDREKNKIADSIVTVEDNSLATIFFCIFMKEAEAQSSPILNAIHEGWENISKISTQNQRAFSDSREKFVDHLISTSSAEIKEFFNKVKNASNEESLKNLFKKNNFGYIDNFPNKVAEQIKANKKRLLATKEYNKNKIKKAYQLEEKFRNEKFILLDADVAKTVYGRYCIRAMDNLKEGPENVDKIKNSAQIISDNLKNYDFYLKQLIMDLNTWKKLKEAIRDSDRSTLPKAKENMTAFKTNLRRRRGDDYFEVFKEKKGLENFNDTITDLTHNIALLNTQITYAQSLQEAVKKVENNKLLYREMRAYQHLPKQTEYQVKNKEFTLDTARERVQDLLGENSRPTSSTGQPPAIFTGQQNTRLYENHQEKIKKSLQSRDEKIVVIPLNITDLTKYDCVTIRRQCAQSAISEFYFADLHSFKSANDPLLSPHRLSLTKIPGKNSLKWLHENMAMFKDIADANYPLRLNEVGMPPRLAQAIILYCEWQKISYIAPPGLDDKYRIVSSSQIEFFGKTWEMKYPEDVSKKTENELQDIAEQKFGPASGSGSNQAAANNRAQQRSTPQQPMRNMRDVPPSPQNQSKKPTIVVTGNDDNNLRPTKRGRSQSLS